MDKNKEEFNFLEELSKAEQPFEESQESPFNEEIKTEEIEEPKEEKPLPFNKDPKIQKFIEKEISKRLENFKPEVVQETPQQDTKIDDVLARLIGNDTPEKVSVMREFKEILLEGTQKAKAEAIAELEARQQSQSQADIEAETELETAFEEIEESFNVDLTSNNAQKTRQEFVLFVEKIAPKDRNGEIVDYPDMISAWETYSEIKKSSSTPSRAKELASRSMTRSNETQTKQPERINWQKVDEFMDSLK